MAKSRKFLNTLRRIPQKLLAGVLLVVLLSLSGCRQKQPPPSSTAQKPESPTQQALRGRANAGHLETLHWPDFSDYKPLVATFYNDRHNEPAWVNQHQATPQAVALTRLFALSGSKGLHPVDYDATLWPARLSGLATASDQQVLDFDTAMTVSAMRYISDLHSGRVNPQYFVFGVDVEAKRYNLPEFLEQKVVSAQNLDQALQGVEPDSDRYRATLAALAQYQAMAQQTENQLPLPAPAQPLSPGAHYAGAVNLAARLVLLGDLDPDTVAPPQDLSSSASSRVYSAALAEGVRNFQSRLNLSGGGKLTPQTVAVLNIPLSVRVRQLEDTLERMRWLLPEYQTAPVVVNIPEYTLRVFGDDQKELFQMRAIVGDAKKEDHQTPIIAKEMRYVVMRPYWNVTPTITREEIAPHAEANRDYIASKNFEVVTRSGKPVENWTAAGLAKNLYMVREKPGPGNSLGLIKFMLPNKLNIYLHSTPAVQLFSRGRRDFSHGCIRLQDPERLAEWVLRDQPRWTTDTIHDAMETGEDNKTVVLKHPIPVLIFYATARVDDEGKVHFFNDIYGYDKEMEAILDKGDPFPVKPKPKKLTGDTA